MTNSFIEAVKQCPGGRTFNGDVSHATTGSAVLDLFALAGNRGAAGLEAAFEAALAENEGLAIRIALWARDCRGGAGERANGRALFRHLEMLKSDYWWDKITALLDKLVEVGRWDDLLEFRTPLLRLAVATKLLGALQAGDRLAAKWAPRRGEPAYYLRTVWGMSRQEYLRILVARTDVVETKMSRRQWSEIVYDHVPSRAGKIYRKAFTRHDGDRYAAWIAGLKTGETKVNASVLFPYEIIEPFALGGVVSSQERDLAVAQWAALPNYLDGSPENILPMVDTSGSMTSWTFYQSSEVKMKATPLDVALSLGLYVADRQPGAFAGAVLAFSEHPVFGFLSGDIHDKIKQIRRLPISYSNTNVRAAFEAILDLAVRQKVPASDMPTMLLVISDMEFDAAVARGSLYETAFEYARETYARAGYVPPKIVFWRINGRAGNNPVRIDDHGSAIVSGFSPAIFQTLAGGQIERFTPYNVMLKTIMSRRYDVPGVTVPEEA